MITRSEITTIILLTIIVTCCCGQYTSRTTQLGLITQWNEMKFVFPTTDHRQLAIFQGKYVRGSSTPLDVDLDYSGKVSSLSFFFNDNDN